MVLPAFIDRLEKTSSASRLVTWLTLSLTGVVLLLSAWCLLWSTFMIYDDEGYVLLSLKNFSENGGLYDQVFSQYGPFYFLFSHLLHIAGLPYTSEAARLLNLVAWLGTAFFSAASVWLLARRSLAATLFSAAAVFAYEWPLINEPSHPGALVCLLLAFIAWAGCLRPLKSRFLATLLGLIGAALVLTKINVGVFLLAGAGAWVVLVSPFSRKHRVLSWAVCLLLLLLPWFLMRPLLGEGWVLLFAWIISSSLACCLLVAWNSSTGFPLLPPRFPAWSAGAFLLLSTATLFSIHLTGTSWHGLLDGVLLSPLHMTEVYTNPVRWRSGTLLLSLASLASAIVWLRGNRARLAPWIVLLRFSAAFGFVLLWTGLVGENFHACVMSFGLSWTWLLIVPLQDDDDTVSQRFWLALLLLPQVMHAFPVAGSQLAWGSFLWIPLLGVSLEKSWSFLRKDMSGLPALLGRLAPLATILLSAGASLAVLDIAWSRHRSGEKLDLPGARNIVLPESCTSGLRILIGNSREYADPLFSIPGQYSLNLWSGIATPTLFNATHWFTLLPAQRQEQIRARLEASPRSCIILEHHIYDYLQERHIATESPLARWMRANYRLAFKIDSYEFWVRAGREIAPLGIAHARESDDPALPRYLIELQLKTERPQQIARIEFLRLVGDRSQLIHSWGPGELKVLVTPSPEGTPLARYKAGLPFVLSGKCQLHLLADRFPATFPLKEGLLRFYDAQNHRVSEARFAD
jgi:hypothetical protein